MTPADLERVRVALTEHENWSLASQGMRCSCGARDWTKAISSCDAAWIEHIVAVLAAQNEAGGMSRPGEHTYPQKCAFCNHITEREEQP